MEESTYSRSDSADNGISYCLWGVVALIVGLFILGIPCGLLAAHWGSEGTKHGATTFGGVVRIGGWAEVIITTIGIVVMIAGKSGTF